VLHERLKKGVSKPPKLLTPEMSPFSFQEAGKEKKYYISFHISFERYRERYFFYHNYYPLYLQCSKVFWSFRHFYDQLTKISTVFKIVKRICENRSDRFTRRCITARF
jgi:hypothetical protein